MTPAARVQAAIEVLDLVIAAARQRGAPADRIVSEWFRTRRFAGSGDRRAVREMVYAAIRTCGEVPSDGRAALLRLAQDDPALAALFDGSRHGPAPIRPDEPVASGGIAPLWLEQALAKSGIVGEEASALLDRAPLDIRINTLRATAVDLPVPGEPTLAPLGRRLPTGTPVESWPQYTEGLVEVQDTGSQIVCLALGALAGERVVDLCAGAGGKTLSLAAQMANRGEILACDVDRARLSRLAPRAERAGASIVETRLFNPGHEAEALSDWLGQADGVLIDAPCSGVGTWRRNPEARWRLDAKELERLATIQSRLLDVGAALVKPGGRLVYITCSLLDAEGRDQVEAFLARAEGWKAENPGLPAGRAHGAGLRLTPHHDGTDGFFVARLVRAC